jgi:hypothetical protein
MSRGIDVSARGQGYCGARFAIGPGPDIIVKLENYRSFLDIYDLVRATLGARLTAKRPSGVRV